MVRVWGFGWILGHWIDGGVWLVRLLDSCIDLGNSILGGFVTVFKLFYFKLQLGNCVGKNSDDIVFGLFDFVVIVSFTMEFFHLIGPVTAG